jgi:hypothetical protein
LQTSTRLVDKDGTVVKTACERCREIFKARNPPEDPDCASCRVDLREENEDAARIFMTVRGQCLTRWNGERDVTVDLNHLAVWAAIDAYGVRDRVECFEKVIRLFFSMLKEQREAE